MDSSNLQKEFQLFLEWKAAQVSQQNTCPTPSHVDQSPSDQGSSGADSAAEDHETPVKESPVKAMKGAKQDSFKVKPSNVKSSLGKLKPEKAKPCKDEVPEIYPVEEYLSKDKSTLARKIFRVRYISIL